VAPQILERIRDCIRSGKYDLTSHAFDEMAEDELSLLDVEQSILSGEIEKMEIDDPHGTKYIIHGTGSSPFVQLATVGRFVLDGGYLIITVYAVDKNGDDYV
jgi:hypothetical protein